MNPLLWVYLVCVMLYAPEGPCKAVHYGKAGEGITMAQVVANRQACPGRHCIEGFRPRQDVVDFIAVRNADQWRIAGNWRALITFRQTDGSWSQPVWLQPADYQKAEDMTSNACRVETSEALAASQGWSLYQGWGRTSAYILRWEK